MADVELDAWAHGRDEPLDLDIDQRVLGNNEPNSNAEESEWEEEEQAQENAPPPVYKLDPEMEAHLLSVCQAVGGYEVASHDAAQGSKPNVQEKYVLGDEGLGMP